MKTEIDQLRNALFAVGKFRDRSDAVVDQIRPLLAGLGSTLQGSVIADIAAIWIAGHLVPGDPAATRELQADMLEIHQRTVADLIEHYNKVREG